MTTDPELERLLTAWEDPTLLRWVEWQCDMRDKRCAESDQRAKENLK